MLSVVSPDLNFGQKWICSRVTGAVEQLLVECFSSCGICVELGSVQYEKVKLTNFPEVKNIKKSKLKHCNNIWQIKHKILHFWNYSNTLSEIVLLYLSPEWKHLVPSIVWVTGQVLLAFSFVVVCHQVVSDSVTPWTVARQVPLSVEFSRQEHWSGLSGLLPGDPPSPGIEPASLSSPALAGGFTSIT